MSKNCPDTVRELMGALAVAWDEQLNTTGPEPSVTVDGYECVGWDRDSGSIVYAPAMDPTVDPALRDAIGLDERFGITEDDLGRMVQERGFTPRLYDWPDPDARDTSCSDCGDGLTIRELVACRDPTGAMRGWRCDACLQPTDGGSSSEFPEGSGG